MWLGENIAALMIMCFPKKWIINRIVNRMAAKVFMCRPDQIRLYKSGRSALCALLKGIRRMDPRRSIAFIPDYTCNVVARACEAAGFSVEAYRSDGNCIPDWQRLEDRLKSCEHPVVVLCSMFGSIPILDHRLSELLQNHPDTVVVADECQNLMNRSPVSGIRIPNGGIVFSFNDKTCPGALGGGCVIPEPLTDSVMEEIGSVRRRLACGMGVAVMSLRKSIRELIHMARLTTGFAGPYEVSGSPEFSSCRRDHYNVHPGKICRLSASRAMLSLLCLDRYARIRLENSIALSMFLRNETVGPIRDGDPLIIPPYVEIRPEIIDVIRREGSPFPVKAPYAYPDNSEVSCRQHYSAKVNVPYVRYIEEKTS